MKLNGLVKMNPHRSGKISGLAGRLDFLGLDLAQSHTTHVSTLRIKLSEIPNISIKVLPTLIPIPICPLSP